MLYNSKALFKREWEANRQEYLNEGWELTPGTTKDQYKNLSDDKVIYIRQPFGDE